MRKVYLFHIVHLLINSSCIIMGNQQHQVLNGNNSNHNDNFSEKNNANALQQQQQKLHDAAEYNAIVVYATAEDGNEDGEDDDVVDNDETLQHVAENINNITDETLSSPMTTATTWSPYNTNSNNRHNSNFSNNNNSNNKQLVSTSMWLVNNTNNTSSSIPISNDTNLTLLTSSIILTTSTTNNKTSKYPFLQQNSPKKHQHQLPKIQRTDAPMLNYIFDSISSANKHHHHDHRYGPHFEDISSTGNITNITVQVGSPVYLNCRISLLQDKTVSWVRRKSGESNLDLLTVGLHTYSGDSRYTMEFQYPNNWRLKIESAVKEDEGTYECQISTYPPRVIQKNLFVNDPKVLIIDEEGIPLQDKFYEVDSTMQLSCIVRHVAMTTSVVFWSHGERILNYDINRGGVSVKTEIMEKGANSTLYIAKINKSDSGNYTCSINSSHDFTVSVHVLNGESLAELHHGGTSKLLATGTRIVLLLLVIGNLLFLNIR